MWESRTSHEVRGLKYQGAPTEKYLKGRTSHEVRGLKYETYIKQR